MIGDSKLDLGSGGRHFPGYVSLDRDPATTPDVVADIEGRFPFEDNTFDQVRAHHILEHVHNEAKVHVMAEIWRVLRPGGVADIEVPTFPSVQAVMDPTHFSFWCRESFWYFEDGNRFRDAFAGRYSAGPVPRFKVLESKQDGWKLSIRLAAVKS